jgi:type II secretion system protein G
MTPHADRRTNIRKGFTLIELLIVVAIIAILAAIAVPNFLEAQTRSKVSRAKSDMRTMATALETYRVDTNKYPIVDRITESLVGRIAVLTTPVSYISTIPQDPFWKYNNPTPPAFAAGGTEEEYCYAPGNLVTTGIFDSAEYRHQLYSIASRGPDLKLTTGAYCMAHPIYLKDGTTIRKSYDPTNGTISDGEIFRLSNSQIGNY